MSKKVYPVILAGGEGTRLWPLSRRAYPKQFSSLIDETSLFQQSALRFSTNEYVSFEKPLTVTHTDYRFIVAEQLRHLGIKPGSILIEPESKNTAPAILSAALHILEKDPSATLIVAPSDHVISDDKTFLNAVASGIPEAESGNIVTFGVLPTHPETAYGYLELEMADLHTPSKLVRFVEKPDFDAATAMLKTQNHLWNAGIFLFRAKDLVSAAKQNLPDLVRSVTKSLEHGISDLDFFRLDHQSWMECPAISIDYGVMERIDNISVVPMSAGWSDLGSWDAIWENHSKDESGVALSENVTSIDCNNVLLRSESDNQHLVGLGLDNIIAISMPDAVLIANKERVQDIKEVVKKLRNENILQADEFPKEHRPWGWFEKLALEERFQVKCITVQPGAELSLQSHHHRSEHWIVVSGTAEVTINGSTQLLCENESAYIPLGSVHRLRNPGKLKMVLIEVQTGAYLGEDDIVRYEDIYARVAAKDLS